MTNAQHAQAHPYRLPPELRFLGVLLGRDAVLHTLDTQLELENLRLLTVIGTGGVGKTTLISVWLERFTRLYPTVQVYGVALAPLTEPNRLASFMLAALQGVPLEREEPLETVCRTLNEQPTLLCLDNFEHLLSAAPLVTDLLERCPQLRIVVTSRHKLALRDEHLLRLEPLELPALEPSFRPLPLEPAAVPSAALQLFVTQAQQVNPNFVLDSHNRSAVYRLCHQLDGLPLALTLVARRMDLLSPQAALARLERGGTVLGNRQRDLPERHHTLEQTLGWSFALLDSAHQELLMNLSLFAGSFSLERVEQLGLAPLGMEPLEGMSNLVDSSMLGVHPEQDRFYLLETLKRFAAKQLVASPQRLEVEKRYATGYLDWMVSLKNELIGLDGLKAMEILRQEYPNILKALKWSIEYQPSIALQILQSLERFWEINARFREGLDYLNQLIVHKSNLSDTEYAALLSQRGVIYMRLGRKNEARKDYLEVLNYQECKDIYEAAQTRNRLANLCIEEKNYQKAIEYLEQAYKDARECEHYKLLSQILNSLSALHFNMQDYSKSNYFAEESLKLRYSHTIFNESQILIAQHNLGSIKFKINQIQLGLELLKKSLFLAELLDYKIMVVGNLEQIAQNMAMWQPRACLVIFGYLEQYRVSVGLGLAENDQAEHAAALEQIRQQLTVEAWEHAWQEGQQMPSEALSEMVQALMWTESQPIEATKTLFMPTKAPRLTVREYEILALIREGMSNKAIAKHLEISSYTVMDYIKTIFAKLEVKNRTQAVAEAVRQGIFH